MGAGWPIKKNVSGGDYILFPVYDNDGDLVTAAADLDTEISKDKGTFTDCTNEATELATSSGMYYLDLTQAELNADRIAIITKTSTADAKTAPNVIYSSERNIDDLAYPATSGRSLLVETDGMIHADVKEWLASAPLALVSQMLQVSVEAYDAAVDFNATQKASINTEADTALTDYDALVPADLPANFASMGIEADGHVHGDIKEWLGAAPNALQTGRVDSYISALAAAVIDAAAIAAGAITSSEAPNLDAAVSTRSSHAAADVWSVGTRNLTALGFTLASGDFNAGFLTAALIATDAIGAAELAADAVSEIADQVWEEAAGDHVGSGSFGGRIQAMWQSTVALEGAVNEAGASTTEFSSDIAEATDKHFDSHWIIFTTGALAGQARPTRRYTGASGTFAFDRAWTDAPSNGDSFIVLANASPALDVLLARLADAEGEAAVTNRMTLWAISKLVNKVDYASTPGTVYKTDDSTSLFQQVITEDSGANPITVLDTS